MTVRLRAYFTDKPSTKPPKIPQVTVECIEEEEEKKKEEKKLKSSKPSSIQGVRG